MSFFARKYFRVLPKILPPFAFVIGVVLRYRFIFIHNRPTDPDNIFGDVAWYVEQSNYYFDPNHVPRLYDTLFPPGVSIYIALMRRLDPSLGALVASQWLLSCLVPVVLAAIALRLFDRRHALYAITFSSLYFPLWEYFGYLFSEGPYLFSMYLAFLLLIFSLQSESAKRAAVYGLLGGIALGVAATFKSVALASAALVFVAILYCRRKKPIRIAPTFASAAVGVILVLTPICIHATRINEGRFLFIANDGSRTFLLGHQGRAGLTWWVDSKRDFHMNFINPSTGQHNYSEVKEYPFGVYESGPNYAAAWKWIKENPGDALLLSVEHVFDMFAVALPYPGYFRSYSRWVGFFNEIFLTFVLLPACYHLIRSRRSFLEAAPDAFGDIIVTAAVASIFIIAFIFLGEGRYRICYDGFMILLAARAFFSPPRKDSVVYAN